MAAKTDPLVHMGTITGGEAREILKENPVILLPMGSHEDQGPHAPMGDYLLAEKIAELAAIRASKAGTRTLVAPVLPFGGADWFGSMTGGIAISQATLYAYVSRGQVGRRVDPLDPRRSLYRGDDVVALIRQVVDGLEPLASERQVQIELALPSSPVMIAGGASSASAMPSR